MAGGPVFHTALRFGLPVQVRRSIVKDDSLVDIVSQLLCEGKKEGWEKGKKGLHSDLSYQRDSKESKECVVVLIKNAITMETEARLSFILGLTIYSFHLCYFPI